ncbi:hypothetical protein C8R44DRAFT_869495 [Mycena epipterygia]|nr:hypothetical protein C8R44DRAFT_869495 [Mycena epipterygia]
MSGFTDGLSPAQVQFQVDETSYFAGAAFTILFYDYFLTLDRETSRYWGTRMTWATVLFYLNRYGLLIGVIPVMVGSFWEGPNKAKLYVSQHARCIILMSYLLIVSSISIMRTYALFGRSRLVLGFMLCVTGGLFTFGTWTMVAVTKLPAPHAAAPIFHPKNGCAHPMSASMARLFGASWAGLLVFDCMILSLTVWKAFVSYRERGGRLLSILVRDGAVYFLVMAVQHATIIASFVIPGPYAYSRGLNTTMQVVLSSVLMNRLMLNLRDPKLSADQSLVSETSTRPEFDISTVEPYYGSACVLSDPARYHVNTKLRVAVIQIPGPYAYSRGLDTTMQIVLLSVLMNRFMLNLRDPQLSAVSETSTRPELDISTVEPYYGSAVY